MAKVLAEQTSVNIGVVVQRAVNAVKEVRSQEQSRKESEFQKAVASGMTYQDQLAFRQSQLDEDNESTFRDPEYRQNLEESIENTKKMIRFESIRTKYNNALDNYVTGKASIDSYISLLNDTLSTEKDETMRSEIRGLVSKANQEKASNELNAIKNRALVAQKDRSTELVQKSIDEVKSRRAKASIVGNEDEVAMWDDTLISLNSSMAKLKIENAANEIKFKVNKYNPKANEKLGYLSDEVGTADSSTEITYQGVTYPSLKAYWENQRSEYISSSYLDEAKAEIDAETARIASTSNFGQIPIARIQAVSDFYTQLKAKPEFASFVEQIEQKRVEAVSKIATDAAEAIYNESDYLGFANIDSNPVAKNAITNIESRFGVKLARQPFTSEVEAGKTIAGEAGGKGTVIAPSTPTTVTTPAPVTTPATTETKPTVGDYVVVEGDNLSKIAAQNKVSLLSILDANPEYKANPSLVRTGAVLKIPAVQQVNSQPTAPVRTEPSLPPSTPSTGITVNPTVPTPTPVVPTEVKPPVSSEYDVQSGDTLSSIAAKSGKTVDELVKMNSIVDPNRIQIGQKIRLQ